MFGPVFQKYDQYAIKVINGSNEMIGHVKGTTAALESKTWDSQNAALQHKGECLVAHGTILSDGNEYEQLVKVEFKRMGLMSKTTHHNDRKPAFGKVMATEANHKETVVASSTSWVSTPSGARRTATAVPVTVSSKKPKREHVDWEV